MRLSEEAIQEFASLYKEEFGEKLTKAEATEMAYRFVTLYELLAKPLPGERLPRKPATPPDEEGPPHRMGFVKS